MKTYDIYTDTVLIPEVIASTLTQDPREERWLADRANRHFGKLPRFRKKVKGANGREFLHMFMEHWLAGLHAHIASNHLRQLALLNWPCAA